MNRRKGIPLEQLATGFERGIEALDELRVLQLGDGVRLQSVQNRVQVRDYERLKQKYGEDHPRTLNVAARIELGKQHLKVLTIVHAGASMPKPEPGEGWAVDGFVRTANGDPISNVTVAAYDPQERWLQEFGYACTNEKGYFAIVVGKLSEKSLNTVFLRASRSMKLLPSNEVRLVPAPKSSDRVDIILDDEAGRGDCMPPPGWRGQPRPPHEAPPGKDRSAQPAKEDRVQGVDLAKGPTSAKEMEGKGKESGAKGPVGGAGKTVSPKGRR